MEQRFRIHRYLGRASGCIPPTRAIVRRHQHHQEDGKKDQRPEDLGSRRHVDLGAPQSALASTPQCAQGWHRSVITLCFAKNTLRQTTNTETIPILEMLRCPSHQANKQQVEHLRRVFPPPEDGTCTPWSAWSVVSVSACASCGGVVQPTERRLLKVDTWSPRRICMCHFF